MAHPLAPACLGCSFFFLEALSSPGFQGTSLSWSSSHISVHGNSIPRCSDGVASLTLESLIRHIRKPHCPYFQSPLRTRQCFLPCCHHLVPASLPSRLSDCGRLQSLSCRPSSLFSMQSQRGPSQGLGRSPAAALLKTRAGARLLQCKPTSSHRHGSPHHLAHLLSTPPPLLSPQTLLPPRWPPHWPLIGHLRTLTCCPPGEWSSASMHCPG